MSTNFTAKDPSLEGLREQVVGTWKLMSAEDVDPNTGKWIPYTFGNPPSGYFIYDATGHASIQIMTTPPVKIATPDSPTPDEALAIFNGYLAYYGTYTVDDVNISVQVEGARDPTQSRNGPGTAIRAVWRQLNYRRSDNLHKNLAAG